MVKKYIESRQLFCNSDSIINRREEIKYYMASMLHSLFNKLDSDYRNSNTTPLIKVFANSEIACLIRSSGSYMYSDKLEFGYSLDKIYYINKKDVYDVDYDMGNTIKIELCVEETPRVIYDSVKIDKFMPYYNKLNIKKVIFHKPATIVYWTDGSKTVVKVNKGERWDPEKGLAMAIIKKRYGLKQFLKYMEEFK